MAGAQGSARPQGPVSLAVSWSGSLAVWSRGSLASSDSSALSLGTMGDRNLQQSVEICPRGLALFIAHPRTNHLSWEMGVTLARLGFRDKSRDCGWGQTYLTPLEHGAHRSAALCYQLTGGRMDG